MTDNNDTLPALLHRIRTGMTTADDAGRVDAMVRAAHDWGWRNGGASCADSRADLLAWLSEGERMRAYANSKTPREGRDLRATPWPVYRAICEHLGLEPEIDVCAGHETAKAPEYWTEADDALSKRWPSAVCWMNPPYSRPGVWCKKAARESRDGSIVIGLLPDDRSTAWYRQWVYPYASAIYITDRRISFLDSGGQPQGGNPKGSIVPIWTPWRVDAPAQGVIQVPSRQGLTDSTP